MKDCKVSEDLVRKELSLIMDFEEIRNSQILSRFIEFVVEKKLLGQEDEIKEYTIAVKGLGKPRDYNPQLDASVRIHAGRLRRILTQYYQETGKNDDVLIDIPKGTYVPIFIDRNNGHNTEELLLPSVQPLDISTTTTAIEYFELQKKPVLAILPFLNLSSGNSNDYFVAGIGEQLSTDMARFQNISVISYFFTSTYKAELKDLQQIKDHVHVDYLLTGSVRFVNELVKINIQLILAENAEIIFSDTHTHPFRQENIFEVQDEIINQVLNVIADDNGIIMNKSNSTPFLKTDNLSVQEAITKYFEFTRDYSTEKLIIATLSLEKAVQIDPNNSLALALLARLYQNQYLVNVTEDKILLDKATELAHLAAELDPYSQHAQKALAWSYLLEGKKEKSFETIERCIKLNPKAAGIITTMALAYICQGDYIRGFKWLLETIHLNPAIVPSAKLCYSLFYYHNKDYVESLRWLERMMIPPDVPFLNLLLLSLWGKIHNKTKDAIDTNILALKENAHHIIGRMIFDEELKYDIIDGLQLAGLTVK
jgi:TolB-like protein/Tfp pilus assembly protein PilF